jgi:phospholipid/cholesterol/gamma-HCH transport system ATP-binding protein
VPIILDNICLNDGQDSILESVSLEFAPSSVTVILGGSGSGKSTVLKIAAGLTPISSGQVLYGDKSLYKLNHKEYAKLQQYTGFMFQDGALWANMNIQQNLSLPLVVSNPEYTSSEVNRIVHKSLMEFDMLSDMNTRPAGLSAGERKIISYLRAVISKPDILFFDEPTSFIDRRGALQLIKALFKFKNEGKTILMVTHDITLANSLGDHFVFMRDGKVELSGSKEACMNSQNEHWLNFMEDRSTEQKETVDPILETNPS